MSQRLYYGKRYLSVDFTGKMDAVGIAEGFGIRGVRITDPDQLLPAITNALASNEPVFIDVPTIPELEEVPPVHAWQQALKGRMPHAGERKPYSSISYAAEWQAGSNISKLLFESM